MSKESYDFVIVGAGAAGCVVASYLAEHTEASIALIEAGETDRDPFIHIPAGFANILIHDRHVWKYETVPQHGTVRAYRAGRVLGGGSSINAMCYVRGQERDYDAWQDAVGDTGRWSYADLLPFSWRRRIMTLSTTTITASMAGCRSNCPRASTS
ncbi:GMC family oxidoreductase N-terminal domain-containing protein [Sphingomonas melonis]|uniref:GMC family oxidoreductase N-terminal domain-containing protein n=1 Tax=Sphingomonas melonis TaxID=152682 RepID=UPI0004770539|nr:GMC family oxidoreductase N-terminal domain-containing protein [Sphingomonas melonis]